MPKFKYTLAKAERAARRRNLTRKTKAETKRAKDRERTKRQHGERHWSAKFTPAQVKAIRAERGTYREIAQKWNISVSTAFEIKKRISYANVA